MNNNKLLFKACATVAIVFSTFCSAIAQETEAVHLGASRVESAALEIAIPALKFEGVDRMDRGIAAARIINFDLKMSGYFKPFANEKFLENTNARDKKRGRIDYKEWRTLSSNYLLKGVIKIVRDGSMIMDIQLYDLQSRRKTYSKRYKGPVSTFRSLAHRASNDILARVTKQEGAARSKIAFVSKVKGRKELFVMDYDGFRPKVLTKDRSIVLFPDWNPTRNLILFTTYRYRNPDLYALDLNTGIRYPLSRRLGLNSTGDWSPDGKKVVFSLSKRGNSDIFTVNADGTGLTRLTKSYATETNPSWSHDGKHIAFTSNRPGVPQIYVMRADGSNSRRLTYRGKYNDGASWSPKGGAMAYTSLLENRFDIVTLEASDIEDKRNREINRLTDGTTNHESPTWSPNGRSIAFMAKRAGRKQIFIMNANGANLSQITFLPGGGYLPSWGPNPK